MMNDLVLIELGVLISYFVLVSIDLTIKDDPQAVRKRYWPEG